MRLLLLLLVLLTPALLQAQTPNAPAMPDSAKMRPASYRSPFVAFAASLVVFPGVGHVYAGETETGLILAGAVLASGYVAARHGFAGGRCAEACLPNATFFGGLFVAAGTALYAHIDAPLAARRYNRRHPRPEQAALRLVPALVGMPGTARLGLSLHLTR